MKTIISEYNDYDMKRLKYLDEGSFNFKAYTLQGFKICFKNFKVIKRSQNYYRTTFMYYINIIDTQTNMFHCFRMIIGYNGDTIVIKDNWKNGNALYCFVKYEDVKKDLGLVIHDRYVIRAVNKLKLKVSMIEKTKARKRLSKKRYYKKKSLL